MQNNDVLYESLQQKLASSNASAEAAEVHGVICGTIATDSGLSSNWFDDLFDHSEVGDLLASECKTEIITLYKDAIKQIEEGEMGMQLLLPSDEVGIASRAQAVTEWCQGFLYAVGLGGEAVNHLSQEAMEAIEDITALTHIDTSSLGEEENIEDEEIALSELTEFLWVAAMLIRDSILDQKESIDHPSNNVEQSNEYH